LWFAIRRSWAFVGVEAVCVKPVALNRGAPASSSVRRAPRAFRAAPLAPYFVVSAVSFIQPYMTPFAVSCSRLCARSLSSSLVK
jgi:hypothetical protein